MTKNRRDYPKHTKNPFVAGMKITTRTRAVTLRGQKRNTNLTILDDQTGEIISGAVFNSFEEVDNERFVKIFVEGVRELQNLTSAGVKVFTILYEEVQENPNTDLILLNPHMIETNMSDKTFERGINDLLSHGIIAKTPAPYTYFINPKICYNGDRILLLKEYVRQSTKTATRRKAELGISDEHQPELDFDTIQHESC